MIFISSFIFVFRTSIAALIQAEQELLKQINSTNAAIDVRKTKMNEEMKIIHKRQAALSRGKDQLRSGSIKVASAVGMTYAGVKFMQPGFDFDEQMSKVQALTRLDKNDPMFAKLREQAEHLGATTWASATQAADAQAFYAMAGFSPQAIMDALPATLDLAKAGGVDVGRAADIGSNILSAFGLEPTEMDKVADILVSVFTRTNTSIEMLGETMKYVGPVARELKIPLEEATAMAGILGNVGIQGSQAGTAMRALQSRLAAPPSAAKKALKELKVSTKDVAGNFRSMPDILADVMKATAKMGNADKLGYLKAIAGEEAGSAFAAFLDKNNYEDLLNVIEAAYNSESESAKVSKTMSDNLKGDWTGLMSAIESVQIAVSTLDGGGLRSLIQSITKIVQATSAWIKENPELSKWIFNIGAGVIAATAAIGGLSMAIGIFNMTILANPVVALIAAIVVAITAVIGVIIYYKDEIWGFFKAIGGFFKTAYDSVISFAKDTVKMIGDGLKATWKFIADTASAIGDFFSTAYNSAISFVKDTSSAVGGFFKAFAKDPKKSITEVMGFMKNLYKETKTFLTEIPFIGPVFKAAFSIGEFYVKALKWAIDKVVNVIEFMINMGAKIVNFFKAFADAPGEYVNKAIDLIKNLYHNIREFLTELPVIGPAFKVAFTVAETAVSLFMKGFYLLMGGVKWLWDSLEPVRKAFVSVFEFLKPVIQPIIDMILWIVELFDDLIIKFDELFSFEAPQWMKDAGNWVGDAWGGIKDGWNGLWEDEPNNNAMIVAGAALTPAQAVSNNDNRTNNLTINVETKSNASAAVIATETVNAIQSSGLIGDLR